MKTIVTCRYNGVAGAMEAYYDAKQYAESIGAEYVSAGELDAHPEKYTAAKVECYSPFLNVADKEYSDWHLGF